MSITPDTTAFARVVLATAAEIVAAEDAIREAIADAAMRGNLSAVLALVERWKSVPVTEVLRPPEGGT